MAQAQTRSCVLVVGRWTQVAGFVREALEREDLQPLWHAPDPSTAMEIAAEQPPGYIVLDFDAQSTDGEDLADALRALAPQAWILDFSGLLRRRPEHARVDLADTRPLVLMSETG